jgi:hypothetical protein
VVAVLGEQLLGGVEDARGGLLAAARGAGERDRGVAGGRDQGGSGGLEEN